MWYPDSVRRGETPWNDAAGLLGRDAPIVFDVGANIGQTTREMREAFPQATIYAFEPVPDTYRLLLENTAALPGVNCQELGLSDRTFSTDIHLQPSSGWNSIAKNIDRGLGLTHVSLTTVDAFCAGNNIRHIHLLKTDTEGHDLHVVRGAKRLLSERSVDVIYAEVGFYEEDRGHTNFCDLWQFLKTSEFQLFGFYQQGGLRHVKHAVEPQYPWTNALFVRDELIQDRFGDDYARWYSENVQI